MKRAEKCAQWPEWTATRPVQVRPTGMNNIIYIVGLVVIVLLILSFLGLR